VPDALFTGTPLEGTQVTGVLSPVIGAAQSYIRTYFADTDEYYDELRTKLETFLAAADPQLPTTGDSADLVNIGFVTDRHCNIGMDRVVVALLTHYGIKTLVSAGDDDFSGSFPFESACTRNLAAKSQQAKMTNVFVAGNHDSARTIADERNQKIKVLDGELVTTDGLTFAGYPDPRSSRYGTGIQPGSGTLRAALLREQAAKTGKLACTSDKPVVVVLHDPAAGRDALVDGCGKAVLALDGHTHRQAGPTPVPLPVGVGYQFVGASSGGAPTETSVERTFASQLTVGPLNHDATVNIVTIDRATGGLVGVTVFRFTPDQQVSVSSLTAGG
jgi:predicted phosphodiesterase